MKGLEQAVNIKLWPGNGEAAKAWGRLKQDPELWDDKGDSFIFLSRGQTDPAFRIHSSLLRETGSDTLVDMLLYGTVRSFGNPPGISHKIYIDPPLGTTGKIDILRYHITTRNFFAFLLKKSLVGLTFYQALVDLHERLETHMPAGTDCSAALRSYLVGLGLVNVSNEPRAAAGLLAWSEDVRWDEGWREAFVHSVGMYDQLQHLQETKDISTPTRVHLDRAHLELQVRIREAENGLSNWYFDDAHFAQEDMPPTVRHASDRFRKFLKVHYEKKYQNWPIKKSSQSGGGWLDRAITMRLQEDFSALYEYCVDRNVTWNYEDGSDHNLRNRKNLLSSSSPDQFWLDAEDDRMLGVFRNLDCRLNALHNIPYPYPILPPAMPAPAEAKKKSFSFGIDKKKDTVRESRLAHAYATASNASHLGGGYAFNELTKAFIRFEKADLPDSVNPREARRERWIIIYCTMQILAGISVDVPNLSFKDDVKYFLNAHLEGLPPWCPEENVFMEASRERSHCWSSPQTWATDSYERRASTKNRLSISQKSLISEHSYDNRPLSPESEDSAAFALLDSTLSAVGHSSSSTPSFTYSNKYQGSHPSPFTYHGLQGEQQQQQTSEASTLSYLSPPQPTSSEKVPQLLFPFTSSIPFHNLFDSNSTRPASSVPEVGSTDSCSDYDSPLALTEASSSGPESSTDRSSRYSSQQSEFALPRPLTRGFEKLRGIEEYSARPLPLLPLPLRPAGKRGGGGEDLPEAWRGQ